MGASAVNELPSFLQKYTYKNNKFQSLDAEVYINAYAGTDVVVGHYDNDKNVYATFGDNGGLTVFDLDDLSVLNEYSYSDARGIDISNNKEVVLLTGQSGTAHYFDTDGNTVAETFVDGATIPESRSTVVAGNTYSVVATGDGGVSVLCNADQSILTNTPQVVVDGIDSELTVTNAADVSNGLVFTANGAAGVYVYTFETSGSSDPCKDVELVEVGKIDFGEDVSANGVFFKANALFVTTGLGGVKVIDVTNANCNGNGNNSDDDSCNFDDRDSE